MLSRHRLAPLAALLMVALPVIALTGCGDPGGVPPSAEVPRSTDPPPLGTSPAIPDPAVPAGVGTTASPPGGSPPGGGTGAPGGPGGFSTTDLAWLHLAIAMDERILRVLELVPGRADDPDVTALARRLTATHRAELSRLRALRDRAGGPVANPHEGHDMPGMATSAQLDALRRASGPAAVAIFAAATRSHLDQSIRLARAVQEHGTEPATRAVAAEIERSGTDQRERLDQLRP